MVACRRLWDDVAEATGPDADYDFELWSMDGNLRAGDDFDQEIQDALRASTTGVFAVSHAMLTSPYIQNIELRHFLDTGKLLVPILLTEINAFADLRGLAPRQILGWNNPYERQSSRATRRRWATKLAEELHRVLDERSAR